MTRLQPIVAASLKQVGITCSPAHLVSSHLAHSHLPTWSLTTWPPQAIAALPPPTTDGEALTVTEGESCKNNGCKVATVWSPHSSPATCYASLLTCHLAHLTPHLSTPG